jgi:2-polyprenyl-3-methyl-5-hydroxy-6-metoxy-1,4-benzoquinol methylase
MKFYQSIAPHYHYIFPFNPAHLKLVLDENPNSQKAALLDIGCGIGSLSAEIANHFEVVKAIDLDEQMIQRAKSENQKDNLEFFEMDMMEINRHFKAKTFQSVICFGNTLVHLTQENQILDFFRQVKKALNDNGKFLFQIINYDRVLDEKIDFLPTIENENIRFVRNYNFNAESGLIHFETKLNVKKTGIEIQNSVPLFPLRKNMLDELLKEVGFTSVKHYGNFKKDTWSEKSVPLVGVAQ